MTDTFQKSSYKSCIYVFHHKIGGRVTYVMTCGITDLSYLPPSYV